MRRAIICVSILCSCLTARAEAPKFSFVSAEAKFGGGDSSDSTLRYSRIMHSLELRYRFFGFLEAYTYLAGQTGWMQVRAPAPEIKSMNFYLYPSLLVGQGVEVRKPLRDLIEFSAFAEIYSSLHTAVAKTQKINADLPADSPSLVLNAYDTNVGELGFKAGIRAQKNFSKWGLRFEIGYFLTDLDILTSPKPGIFSAVPAKVSEIDRMSQVAHAAIGASVRLPKRLYLTLDAGIDIGKSGSANSPEGIGVVGYSASIGLGYAFR